MPPKWLLKLEDFLSRKAYKKAREKKALKEVLARLRKFRDDLRERLEDEKNPKKRKRIEKKLKVIHAQRKKGLKALRKLRED